MLFADHELARRLEAAHAASGAQSAVALARTRPDSGAATLPIAGGTAVYAGVDSPVTQALGMGLSEPITADHLETLEAFYGERGAGVKIEVAPLVDAGLYSLLHARGYRLGECTTVLVRPLTSDDALPAPATGIEVRPARADEAPLCASIMMRGFGEKEILTQEDLRTGMDFFASGTEGCFLAWLGGEGVGCGSMGTWEGIASLQGAATLIAYRRRGVQTALIHARLALAVDGGCNIATCSTLPGSSSQRNMERLGFRVVYTRLAFFRDRPGDAGRAG